MTRPPGKRRISKSSTISKWGSYRPVLEDLEGRTLPSGVIAVGPDGDVWFEHGSYLGRISPNTGAEQLYYLPPGTGFPGDLAFAADGELWMNVGYGLVRFDPSSGTSEAFHLSPGKTLGGMFPHLTADSSGNLWFLEWSANGNLVASLNSATGVIHEYPFSGTIDMNAGVAVETDGTVWFGATIGPPISPSTFPVRLDPVTGAMTEFPATLIGPSNLITGTDGTIWSLYDRSGFGKLDPNTQQSEFIPFRTGFGGFNFFTISGDGNIWMAGQWGMTGGVFDQLNPATGIQNLFNYPSVDFGNVGGIASATNGDLWFINPVYIINFNPATGVIHEYSVTGSPPGFSYSGTFIISASETPPGAYPGSAGVDWGDGTFSGPAGTVVTVEANGDWIVTANHTYRFPGTYAIEITLSAYGYPPIAYSLHFSFTAVIAAPAPSSSLPSGTGSSNPSLAFSPVGLFTAAHPTNAQAISYSLSPQSIRPQPETVSVITSTTVQTYQYSSTRPPTTRGGGMGGRIQVFDDPLQESPMQPPMLDSTPVDFRESTGLSADSLAVFPLESDDPVFLQEQEPSIDSSGHNSRPITIFWNGSIDRLDIDWISPAMVLPAEEPIPASTKLEEYGQHSVTAGIASMAAFLAAFRWKHEKSSIRGKTKIETKIA